jgi:hypothetical protein
MLFTTQTNQLHSYINKFILVAYNRIITKLITQAIKNLKFYVGK